MRKNADRTFKIAELAIMRIVRVKIPGEGLLTGAHDLQDWLDQFGFDVTYFKYELSEEGQPIEIDIEFPDDNEAEVFRSEFDGKYLVWLDFVRRD
jgi:hypothetical protein